MGITIPPVLEDQNNTQSHLQEELVLRLLSSPMTSG